MDSDRSTCAHIQPGKNQPHTHTVIFLHGEGITARELRQGSVKSPQNICLHFEHLPKCFPTFRWVFPQALPHPVSRKPQWFEVFDDQNRYQNEDVGLPGLRRAIVDTIILIREEAQTLGGQFDHIVLAGHGMGCAVAVQTLFNLFDYPYVPYHHRRLAAFMGFGGWYPFFYGHSNSLWTLRRKMFPEWG